MARYAKGREAIHRDIIGHRDMFDLRRDGLGRELCGITTDGIKDTIDAQQTPDGAPWAPLSEAYATWKSRKFPGQPMAVLHHLMIDPAEVEGIIEVNRSEASVLYGVSEQARQEAEWFQEGGPNQPPREFWGINADALQLVDETLEQTLEDGLTK